jgi:hypothetical protein
MAVKTQREKAFVRAGMRTKREGGKGSRKLKLGCGMLERA